MFTHARLFLASMLLAVAAAGCSAPLATLDLITVARKAIADAQEDQVAQHAELIRHLKARSSELDQAFDTDVQLVAAGQIKDASGKAVNLTPQWVISARKGYIAARNMINDQVRSADAAQATRLDNLKAADETLDMASQLVLRQWSIGQGFKDRLLSIQRTLMGKKKAP